jgi:hypothetical protein
MNVVIDGYNWEITSSLVTDSETGDIMREVPFTLTLELEQTEGTPYPVDYILVSQDLGVADILNYDVTEGIGEATVVINALWRTGFKDVVRYIEKGKGALAKDPIESDALTSEFSNNIAENSVPLIEVTGIASVPSGKDLIEVIPDSVDFISRNIVLDMRVSDPENAGALTKKTIMYPIDIHHNYDQVNEWLKNYK